GESTAPSIQSSHTSNLKDEISKEVKSLPVSISMESHVSDSSSSKPSQKNNPEISHKVFCSAEVDASFNLTHDHAYF
ncbi:29780_t:CDS:1, partial [Gigaspora margarita]